jgi:hypothetical protein
LDQIEVCPRCDGDYKGRGSLSRRDNKTDICPTCGQEEAINDAQPIKAWTMILATSGDSMDRLIREKKFQDKIGVDFNDWMDWKKIMDERHD